MGMGGSVRTDLCLCLMCARRRWWQWAVLAVRKCHREGGREGGGPCRWGRVAYWRGVRSSCVVVVVVGCGVGTCEEGSSGVWEEEHHVRGIHDD